MLVDLGCVPNFSFHVLHDASSVIYLFSVVLKGPDLIVTFV
jgi:hypothetical protein